LGRFRGACCEAVTLELKATEKMPPEVIAIVDGGHAEPGT
jgi:hypothetical protein